MPFTTAFFLLSSGVLPPSSTVTSEQIWTSCKHLVFSCCQLQRKKYLCWLPSHALLVFGFCSADALLAVFEPKLSLSFPLCVQVLYLMRVFLRAQFLLTYYKISVSNELPSVGIIHAAIPSSPLFNSFLLAICCQFV